ncbi:hypothetical protein [Phytoactinopolyspora limicola]|uniref:hypothetical protein n=1 Tax=Phytoactinopolyspora limicola TaxID=2715536 RepID=UPI00140E1617|nr:hypothetical protein [Phytoactinopolyspora limicola]
MRPADQPPPSEPVTVRVQAAASPGLLARLAAVINPHPVTGFHFTEQAAGSVTVTVQLAEQDRPGWHTRRVMARLGRVVGVTAVELVGTAQTQLSRPSHAGVAALVSP